MPFDFTQENSATVSTAARSMPANTTTGVPTSQTDTCQLQGWVKVNAIAAGDEFLVQLYEKVLAAGAQVVVEQWRITFPRDKLVIPALILHNAWDLVVSKVSGTDRVVEWSLRKVT